jgi:hypothetical protein
VDRGERFLLVAVAKLDSSVAVSGTAVGYSENKVSPSTIMRAWDLIFMGLGAAGGHDCSFGAIGSSMPAGVGSFGAVPFPRRSRP